MAVKYKAWIVGEDDVPEEYASLAQMLRPHESVIVEYSSGHMAVLDRRQFLTDFEWD